MRSVTLNLAAVRTRSWRERAKLLPCVCVWARSINVPVSEPPDPQPRYSDTEVDDGGDITRALQSMVSQALHSNTPQNTLVIFYQIFFWCGQFLMSLLTLLQYCFWFMLCFVFFFLVTRHVESDPPWPGITPYKYCFCFMLGCFFFFFFFSHEACGISGPWAGIAPHTPWLGRQSLNHWTTRKVLSF